MRTERRIDGGGQTIRTYVNASRMGCRVSVSIVAFLCCLIIAFLIARF